MLDTSARFLYRFFILFLSILLLMFVMFAVMVHYDSDMEKTENPVEASGEEGELPEQKGGGLGDLTPLYRANLFAINLCLIVVAETLLIMLFVKYTVPATLVATLTIIFMTFRAGQRLRSDMIPGVLSPLVTNRYATLSHTDLMLLIILSGLIMAFLMSVLLKEASADRPSEKSQETSSHPPLPPPPL